MEKIAIISDVHANITALNAVLEDMDKRNVNKIFCLGDSIIKCTHPDLVIDKLREVCEVILIGNSDYAICRPEVKNRKFWTREIIGEEKLEELTTINPKLVLSNKRIDIRDPQVIELTLKEKILMKFKK